jgi:hypothetical protein
MSPIRLLIVDDHPVLRDGLRSLFTGDAEFEVVGEAGDGAEAVRLAQQVDVDVILMDLRMPTMGGVEAIPRLGNCTTQRGCSSSPPTTPTGASCPPSTPGRPGTCSRTRPARNSSVLFAPPMSAYPSSPRRWPVR